MAAFRLLPVAPLHCGDEAMNTQPPHADTENLEDRVDGGMHGQHLAQR